ncbi:MAG: carboxypeptidase-like regulatory domain-containing protein [Phycisphaerae bacterium]|nr:carboxypeptidase-like regulatory domain-containing protein [Gemmatimonadaceae bacterium]
MRFVLAAVAGILAAQSTGFAQTATVTGQITSPAGDQPIAFATIANLSNGTQQLATDNGRFSLANVPVGLVRLRFKRVGFAAADTTISVSGGDALQLRIIMIPLVLALPEVVVSGVCTNETPRRVQSSDLVELFDQVKQNAERLTLFVRTKPFVLRVVNVQNNRNVDGQLTPFRTDTIERNALPAWSYVPKQVIRGRGIMMPELTNFADTAFTNNHCFHYAGQTRFGTDSVIAVDFEPVPSLAKEADLFGTMYLQVGSYQLVGVRTTLSNVPPDLRLYLQQYTTVARFKEIAPGIPVLSEWELENRFVDPKRLPFVQTSRVLNIRWSTPGTVMTDSMHPHR